jgi:hypothetical protein
VDTGSREENAPKNKETEPFPFRFDRSGKGSGRGMKVATFNINNVNRRLPNLLRWSSSGEGRLVGIGCVMRNCPYGQP